MLLQVSATPAAGGGGGMYSGGSGGGGGSRGGSGGGNGGQGSSNGDANQPDVSSFPWWKVVAVLGVVGGSYVLRDRITGLLGFAQKEAIPATDNAKEPLQGTPEETSAGALAYRATISVSYCLSVVAYQSSKDAAFARLTVSVVAVNRVRGP